ncbi:hypothetical protein ABIA32_004856 [Streptacidiphilus sp. MAP12-20]|uniref:hypothetical protein n=1 Tax=Streptacidiphilus sp. MAP12-20 TaxID=3156299 RepID=UPI00351613F3
MPSLRNPVGPLPASIYWRRRLVVLAALASAATLVSVLTFGGGGGKQPVAGGVNTPVGSITPGPTGGHGATGSNDGTAGGSGSTPGTGSSASSAPTGSPSGAPVVTGPGGSGGSNGSAGSTGSTNSTGSTGSSSGGSGSGGSGNGSGGTLTANQAGTMNLPVCNSADLDLSLTSTAQTYAASQFPAFHLGITNTGGGACRVDLGAKSAVLKVTSDTGAQVWSSGDCPKDASAQWYAVPAAGGGGLNALFGWGRTTSKPGCTPGSGGSAAAAGTYVAHIAIGGVSAQPQHWFKLAPFGS